MHSQLWEPVSVRTPGDILTGSKRWDNVCYFYNIDSSISIEGAWRWKSTQPVCGNNKLKVIFGNVFKNYLFVYFWLSWDYVAVYRLSLIAASWGYSLLHCVHFSLRWPPLLQSMAFEVAACGLSSCGYWPLELGFSSCGARTLVTPRYLDSSQTRGWNCVPCIGRQIPIHYATREVLYLVIFWLRLSNRIGRVQLFMVK